jgi:hypothetical protein
MIHLTVYNSANEPFILDLNEAESIYLNKQFSSISDFTTRGGYSRDFRIPMTSRNSEFFSAIWNPNETNFNFKTRVKATVTVDTIPIAEGHIQVKRVYSKGERWHEADIVFFSTVPNLISAIGSKKISELTNISGTNHEMAYSNFPVPNTNPDGLIKYGLTDRGQKWSELESDWAAGARPIFSTTNPLYIGELTPFVKIKWLFDEVFSDAGFTYESSSLESIIENYYMPFITGKDLKTIEGTDSAYFLLAADDATNLASGTFDLGDISMVEYADNGGNVDASFVFTAPYAASFQFAVRFNTHLDDWTTFQFGNNSFTVSLRDIDTGEILWSASAPEYWYATQNLFTPTLLLSYGQRIEMIYVLQDYVYYDTGSASWYTFNDHIVDLGTGLTLIAASSGIILQGGTFNGALNAPDYGQAELVRDIVRMHNLVMIPDENNPNHIIIETMDDYLQSGGSADWTKKLDYEKDVVLYAPVDEQKKKFRWTYKAGGEYLSQLFVTIGKRVFGDYELYQTNNEFATGEEVMELGFASTPLNEVANTNLPIPKFVDSQGAFVNAGARCLYLTDVEPSIAVYDEVAEEGVLTSVYSFSHSDGLIPDVADNDLNFAPETYLQQYTAFPVNNLFNRFWRRYYNEIYDEQSRIMEAYFTLDLNDYKSIQFSDVIYIKDSYWRVLEISDYVVGKMVSSKCKLIKIIDIPAACGFTPYTSIANGQIMFTDGTTDNLAGSKSCCELYGYTWNADSEKCFAFGGSGRPSQVTNESFEVVEKPIVRGNGNVVEIGNNESQVLGDFNTVKSEASGSLVVGQGVYAKQRGLHFGVNPSLAKSQGGLLSFSGAGTYPASASKIEINLNGTDTLNLDDGTTWLCELSVVMSQNASTKHSAIFAFYIYKNTTAAASAVTTITQVGGLNTLGAAIDVISNTAEHRLSIGMTGGSGYPYTVEISGILKYTQIK